MSTDTTQTPAVRRNGGLSLGVGGAFDSFDGFDSAWRMANAIAASDMVPKEYKGNPANCVLALDIASRMGCGPFLVMQNLNIVHGRPSWGASFVIASVEASGKFGPIRYRWTVNPESGHKTGCTAVAKDIRSGEDLEGTEITWEMVNAEGWYSRAGSKWKTMPEQMFRYRAATFWARAFAPGILMGLVTSDEAVEIDVTDTARVVEAPKAEEKSAPPKGAAGLKAALKKAKGEEAQAEAAAVVEAEPVVAVAEAEAAWAPAAKYLDKRGYSRSQQASIRGRAMKIVDAGKAPDLAAAAEMVASEVDPAGMERDGGDEGMPS